MELILISLIRLYQLVLSPLLAMVSGGSGGCRFHPNCSAYAVKAIKTHGALKGGRLALRRLTRCHPWGGANRIDPVPGKP